MCQSLQYGGRRSRLKYFARGWVHFCLALLLTEFFLMALNYKVRMIPSFNVYEGR